MEKKRKGIAISLTASIFWGISGIIAQYLMENYNADSEWLVSVRLLVAGIILLLYSKAKYRKDIFRIFKVKSHGLSILIFSILGMMGLQFTYFKTIEYSGTAVATIFQYTAPVLILLWLYITGEDKPRASELVLVFSTFLGVFFVVTNGNLKGLKISPMGFLYGTASALACAIYTLQPRNILARYEASLIVGWGMLIGGISFQLVHPFWKVSGKIDIFFILMLLTVIFLGTILGFLLYLDSLNYISPALTSILTVAEPLVATVLSFLIFGKVFGFYEFLGFILIMLSVIILSVTKKS